MSALARQAEPDRAGRDRAVRRVLAVVLLANLTVAGGKLGLGYSLGALSLLADGVHALLDASANVLGLIGITLSARPPDPGHPYGHRRFEALAALGIGLLILAGLFEIVGGLWGWLHGTRRPPDPGLPALALLLLTIGINVLITGYEARAGRRLRSAILLADAGHTRSDTFATSAVLAALVATRLGAPWADPLAALVVAVLIGRTAYRVLQQNLAVLADHAVLDPAEVERIARTVPGVRLVHRVRSRGGPDHIYLDLHIHLDPHLPLTEAHRLTHQVADTLRAAIPGLADVIIHTEPAREA